MKNWRFESFKGASKYTCWNYFWPLWFVTFKWLHIANGHVNISHGYLQKITVFSNLNLADLALTALTRIFCFNFELLQDLIKHWHWNRSAFFFFFFIYILFYIDVCDFLNISNIYICLLNPSTIHDKWYLGLKLIWI